MDENDWLAERFEANRVGLRAVAYRMLGSLSEADDAVQDAWLRLSRSDTSDVDNLSAWLTTVVGRVCLDMLRSRRSRREDPLDVYVPDPVVSRADGIEPEQEALLADAVGLALLVVPWSPSSTRTSCSARTTALCRWACRSGSAVRRRWPRRPCSSPGSPASPSRPW